jgi:hypothetical protein
MMTADLKIKEILFYALIFRKNAYQWPLNDASSDVSFLFRVKIIVPIK